ncbi:hypothetical protein AKJ37_07055, partial [candidate division MSBL1 archaeon SCGC-AAA259I09]
KSDVWLQIRPGTDCALYMGMINEIIKEDLYDEKFVEKWCFGFEKLKERVKEYPLEKVEKITWIPKEKIKEAVKVYVENKPATIPWGVKNDMQGRNSPNIIQAKAILRSITGNLDIKGGDALWGPSKKVVGIHELELNEEISNEQLRKQLGSDQYRLGMWPGWERVSKAQRKVWKPEKFQYVPRHDCTGVPHPLIWQAILSETPYPIKAIICQAANPIITCANSKRVHRALKNPNLELLVVHDHVKTPTAMLADYALPAADHLERTMDPIHLAVDLAYAAGEPVVVAGKKPVEPKYERKSDFWFWRQLALRFGHEEYWPWENEEELWNYCFDELDFSYEELAEREKNWEEFPVKHEKYRKKDPNTEEQKGFGTPTGKVELYSTILQELGYDPLPHYEEPPESPISSPEKAEEYPYILIAGSRFRYMFHSEYRELESLRKIYPDPEVEINPSTAAEEEIKEGDWVWIETPRGKIKQKAKITEKVHPSMINAQHGWWFPEKDSEEPELFGAFESNINVCTDDEKGRSPEIGSWPLSSLLCKIEPVR